MIRGEGAVGGEESKSCWCSSCSGGEGGSCIISAAIFTSGKSIEEAGPVMSERLCAEDMGLVEVFVSVDMVVDEE